MSTEYKLSHTAIEIDEKLGKIDSLAEQISQLSSEKVDKMGITLGVHTDGLVYIFVNGSPQGNGLDIQAEVVEGDVFGYVDENNNIVLNGNLTNGTYTVKYEMADGSAVDIGNLTLSNDQPEAPTYKNLLPLSTDTDGSPYNGGKGYKEGYKMSGSSGGESATTGAYCSGFIPLNNYNDEIYIKNITLHSGANVNNIIFYDSNKTKVYSATGGTAGQFNPGVLYDNGVYHTNAIGFTAETNIAFFRFSCGGITDETIVTVNEEIV